MWSFSIVHIPLFYIYCLKVLLFPILTQLKLPIPNFHSKKPTPLLPIPQNLPPKEVPRQLFPTPSQHPHTPTPKWIFFSIVFLQTVLVGSHVGGPAETAIDESINRTDPRGRGVPRRWRNNGKGTLPSFLREVSRVLMFLLFLEAGSFRFEGPSTSDLSQGLPNVVGMVINQPSWKFLPRFFISFFFHCISSLRSSRFLFFATLLFSFSTSIFSSSLLLVNFIVFFFILSKFYFLFLYY